MSIVKMKHVRLIGLTEERDDLLARLLHVGCVEVTEPAAEVSDPEWAALVRKDDNTSLGEVKGRVNAVNSALNALKKYAPPGFSLFEVRSNISERDFFDPKAMAHAMSVAAAINDDTHKIAQLFSKENKLTSTRAGLAPWKELDVPLEEKGTATTAVALGTCPGAADFAAMQSELAEKAPLSELYRVSATKEMQYLVLICWKGEQEAAEEALRQHSFSYTTFKDVTGTAAENLARIEKELQDCAAQREELAKHIASFADARQDLKICLDRLNQDAAKAAVRDRLLTDGTILFLEGWVPVPDIPALEEELTHFCCAYEYADPEETETVPTLLRNPKWMRCMNMVTEMYSLPDYRGIDPNPLIFGFYIIFFGFMFADVAYGLIILAACTAIIAKFHPKKTLGYMMQLGQWLGLSTTIFGALTGGFFGDFLYEFTTAFTPNHVITLPAVINPLQDPMTILIIAIIMGAIHMIFGQCVHIYMEARDGHPLEGVLDVVPWWIVFAGVGLFAAVGTPWGIAAGFLALLLTQGRHKKGFFGKLFGGIASWYDVTSWLGDILSYSRLMALMLATSVIAQVMNILGTLPGNIIVFFLIFIIGHVFNIGINLIGTYVHAARLQYLEFFGRFYKEGGVPFKPLKYDTKYVDVVNEAGEVI